MLTKGTPTANDAPAKPSTNPNAMTDANDSCQTASAASGSRVKARRPVNTRRPPMRSVRMPSGMRISDPISTGTAIIIANWTSERSSRSWRSGPSGPIMLQA